MSALLHKMGQKSPKTLPKWSEMGSKINLFSSLPKKSFFGFYLRNNHIPTVLGRPFSGYFPAETGVANWSPNKSLKIHLFLVIVQNV